MATQRGIEERTQHLWVGSFSDLEDIVNAVDRAAAEVASTAQSELDSLTNLANRQSSGDDEEAGTAPADEDLRTVRIKELERELAAIRAAVTLKYVDLGLQAEKTGTLSELADDLDRHQLTELEFRALVGRRYAGGSSISLAMKRSSIFGPAVILRVEGDDLDWVAATANSINRVLTRGVPSWARLRSGWGAGAVLLAVLLTVAVPLAVAVDPSFLLLWAFFSSGGFWFLDAALRKLLPGFEVAQPGQETRLAKRVRGTITAVTIMLGIAGILITILAGPS